MINFFFNSCELLFVVENDIYKIYISILTGSSTYISRQCTLSFFFKLKRFKLNVYTQLLIVRLLYTVKSSF